MAQYITAPQYSYEPLPMEQYIELAKTQGQMFEGAKNEAYNYLSKLPILQGGLGTEELTPHLQQKYQDKVQASIDRFLKSKDRSELSREISAIDRELKTDNDVLVNNYMAQLTPSLLQRSEKNPDLATAYTADGSGMLYTVDGKSNVNPIQPGQYTPQQIETQFNTYSAARDFETDTAFIDDYGENIREVISNITPVDGGTKWITTTSGRTYSNFLDAVRDEAGNQGYELSKEAITALEVKYDENNDATTQWYNMHYRNNPEIGKQKYIEDVFKYRYPKEYATVSKENLLGGSSGTSRSRTAEAEANRAALYVDMINADAVLLAENANMSPSLIQEVQRQARAAMANGMSLEDIKTNDSKLYELITQVEENIAANQLVEVWKQSEEGQKFEQEKNRIYDETMVYNSQEDGGDLLSFFMEQGINLEEFKDLNNAVLGPVYSPFLQNVNWTESGKWKEISESILNPEALNQGLFMVPFEGDATELATQSMMGPAGALELYRQTTEIGRYYTFDEVLNYESPGNLSVEDSARNAGFKRMAQIFKDAKDSGMVFTEDNIKTLFTGYTEFKDKLEETGYNKKVSDLLEGSEVVTQATTIRPNALMMDDTMPSYNKAVIGEISGGWDDFSTRYDMYKIDPEEGDKPGLTQRRGEKKVGEKEFKALNKGMYKSGVVTDGGLKQDHVRINGYEMPHSSLIQPGLKVNFGDETYMIVPKKSNESFGRLTGWVSNAQASISGKPIGTYAATGVLGGLTGDDIEDIMRKNEVYTGSVSYSNRNTKNVLKNRGIDVNNAYMEDYRLVVTLDNSDIEAMVKQVNGKTNVSGNQVIQVVDKDTKPISWNSYFGNLAPESQIPLRESLSLINSMQITEDLDPRQTQDFTNTIYQMYQSTGSNITYKQLSDLYKEKFGEEISLASNIAFNNQVDAIDFYRFNPEEIRGKKNNRVESQVPGSQRVNDSEVVTLTPEGPLPFNPDSLPELETQIQAPVVEPDTLVQVPGNPAEVALPETVVEEIVEDTRNESNLSAQEEVVEAVAMSNPDLITNPLSASMEYLGLDETDSEQYSTIAGFFDEALGDFKLQNSEGKNKTAKELATSTAWCAAFANHILNKVNLPTLDSEFARIRALEYAELGEPVTVQTMLPGDIFVRNRKEGYYHVGFVVGINSANPEEILVLGGNQGDKVQVMAFSIEDVYAIRRLGNLSTISEEDKEKLSKDFIESGATL